MVAELMRSRVDVDTLIRTDYWPKHAKYEMMLIKLPYIPVLLLDLDILRFTLFFLLHHGEQMSQFV